MPFTDEERRLWHENKRTREQEVPRRRPPPVATCVNCDNPFANGEGVITEEPALCDLCLGD